MHQRKKEINPTIASITESNDLKPESNIDYIKRKVMALLFFIAACYGLYEIDFVQVIFSSPMVRRDWFHLGLFFSTLVMFIGWYLEFYRHLFLQMTVNYETAQTSTHTMLISIIFAGIAFHFAFWPLWHWKTPFYLFMFSYGFLFQFIVLFHPWIQRILYICIYLWFMHSYFSPFMI